MTESLLAEIRARGRQAAAQIPPPGSKPVKPKKGQAERILARAQPAPEDDRRLLNGYARLVRTAEKESIEATDFRTANRSRAVAEAYLDCVGLQFAEESCAAFLEGFQEIATLRMGEIWALKPALQSEILHRLETSDSGWRQLVMSLRRIGETAWKELFESVSRVDRILSGDPAGIYCRMDFDSRERYRSVIAQLAKYGQRSELEVAGKAVELACGAQPGETSRAALRRRHVGYYLIDAGSPVLEQEIAYRPLFRARFIAAIERHPAAFYLGGIALVTLAIAAFMLWQAGSWEQRSIALALLLLPATQTAVEFMNYLATYLMPPRGLPKLDFSAGVPAECATVVAVPALLLSEAQAQDMALDLEVRFLANRHPNLYFALVTDLPDSDKVTDDRDRLAAVCAGLIEGMNRKYPESPFLMFHRTRVYNDSEGRWMGWERKRGKLLDFNQLMRGGFDAFPLKVGNVDVLPRMRYVIALDSDTQLPRDGAAALIGAIAHPLNTAVVDPVTRIVTEGYGILQPRIGVSIQSAARSRLAALFSGETGFDIYTRAISDVYQDLFREAIFTGKGIYEIDVMRAVLERRFPENALLSHDLIEGAYARVALASDIELIDDYPSHFSAYNRRKHRWIRGDWQIMRWIFPRVPGYSGGFERNPISVISKWKILDNLRRSLVAPGLILLLLGSWFLLSSPAYWTIAAVALLFLPVYCNLFFALLRAPFSFRAFMPWLRDTARGFLNGHTIAAFELIFLLHDALLSMDAIIRSLLRVFVTKRRLLEWETAAEAEAGAGSNAAVDIYLKASPWVSGGIALALCVLRLPALPVAAPVLLLWGVSGPFCTWLNREPSINNRPLEPDEQEWLRAQGTAICGFFRDWSSSGTNWLIPDSVSEDGTARLLLTPTNLGLLLNARIAMLHLGVIGLAEFIGQTRETLRQIAALPKHGGHLLNWCDVTTLQPLEPPYVSTVDSGNFAAALWTLKQAALAFAAEPEEKRGRTGEMAAELKEIADRCEVFVREMDFSFLYNPRKKALSLGYDLTDGKLEVSHYGLLASEARTAVFIAIAKGDIPQEAWLHLGRAHVLSNGARVLLSWTGTMFEYLMPMLWMRHHTGTITEQTICAVVRAQQAYGSRKRIPWGISESACAGYRGGEPGYAPFGIPTLSLRQQDPDALVIAPYSSFLALMADPGAALENLRRMERMGWSGRYGLYEAVDCSRGGRQVIRRWMAHHQGMALLAICNVLYDWPLQRFFHAEPQVLATELLLHERLPASVMAEPPAASPAMELERPETQREMA